MRWSCLLAIGCGGPAEPTDPGPTAPPAARPATPVIADPREDGLDLRSADRLAFAPAGYLVVGEGARDRLVIVETDDFTPDATADDWGTIPNLPRQLADALGADRDDVVVDDVAVNPLSGRTWVAAHRQDTTWAGVFTVTADGGVELVDLGVLRWAAVPYPEVAGAGSVVTDLEVAGGFVIAAVTEQSWTASQVVTAQLPVTNGQDATVTSTRTYHRSHRQWETFAPITTMFAYEDGGRVRVGASYQCAPVVRFDAEDLAAGAAETVGTTPYDYGSFRQVSEFAVIGTGADRRVLASVTNLGGTEIDEALFLEEDEVDEAAPIVFDGGGQATHPSVDRAPKLDDLVDLDVLDEDRLVRLDADGELSITDAP